MIPCYRFVAAVALIGVIAACSSRSEGTGGSGADGALVKDVASATLETLPMWSLEGPALVIGTADGPREYSLVLASSPWVLGDGRIVVANGQREIRYYDATGKHLATAGRRGQGPGEFGQLWALRPTAGDSLLAFDFTRWVSLLDPQGRHVRYLRTAGGPVPVSLPLVLRHRDVVYATAPRRGANLDGEGTWQDTAVLVRRTLDGRSSNTIARLPAERWAFHRQRYIALPFSGSLLVAADSGRIIVAHGDDFALRWYDAAGELLRVVRVPMTARPVSAADVAAWEAELDRMRAVRRMPVEGDARNPFAGVHADKMPLIERLVVDRLGNTWVRRWSPFGASTAEWIVFSVDGEPSARLEAPARFRPNDIGADYVLGIFRDADDVDFVRRYTLRR